MESYLANHADRGRFYTARVRLSHARAREACPLYPKQQKYLDAADTAAKCQTETYATSSAGQAARL